MRAGTKLITVSPALNGATSANVGPSLFTITANQLVPLPATVLGGGSNASFYQPMSGCMVPVNVTGPVCVLMVVKSSSDMANETTNWTSLVPYCLSSTSQRSLWALPFIASFPNQRHRSSVLSDRYGNKQSQHFQHFCGAATSIPVPCTS